MNKMSILAYMYNWISNVAIKNVVLVITTAGNVRVVRYKPIGFVIKIRKKSLNMLKRQSESINRRTGNTMVKRR